MKQQYSFSSHRTKNIKNIKKQKQKFLDLVRDIIRISDVVLEILDARFIEETRNFEFERLIKEQGKKIIYVLNKSDLVDSKKNFLDMRPYVYVSAKTGAGVRNLRNKIKEMVKKVDLDKKKRAQVGIIGYPNTGKSSLINLLTRKSSAGTGAEAGFTQGMQKIRFSSNILILDTPGVIPEVEYSNVIKGAIHKQVKVGARTVDKIKEPDMIVFKLMEDYSGEIEMFYGIDADGNPEVLIEKLGRKKGFLKRGGVVDIDRTSRLIIKDWQTGKIKVNYE